MPLSASAQRFVRGQFAFIVYTIAVIVWGAFVRATRSGAGCGRHWPLCNGEVIPLAPSAETLVEFTHRLTSGLCWLWAALMCWWAFRAFAPKHSARKGAVWVLILMTTEALVGAALVLLELVADNPSLQRGWVMGAHLLNTFLLLLAMVWTLWWARGGGAFMTHLWSKRGAFFSVGLLAILLVSMMGAITALGDTLFPVESLAEGIAQDFSATAHLFLRLRVWHPVSACIATIYLFSLCTVQLRLGGAIRNTAIMLLALLSLQIAVGFINLGLLAPLSLQLVHLVLADLVWMALAWLTALSLEKASVQRSLESETRDSRPETRDPSLETRYADSMAIVKGRSPSSAHGRSRPPASGAFFREHFKGRVGLLDVDGDEA